MREHQVEEVTDVVNPRPSRFRSKAVAVHLYTASGAAFALLMLVAAFQGEAVKALWLMLAPLLIDSTDGLLPAVSGSARRSPSSTGRSWTTSSTT